MAPIVHTIDIDRGPDEVFAYVTVPSRFTEWQAAVSSASAEGSGPLQQGSRMIMTRKMGPREQTMTAEIMEYDSPRSYAFRVLDGPVRAIGKGSLEPVGEGDRTRFTIQIHFEGHGIGKLLVPLVVRRQAQKEIVQNQEALKKVLEQP